MTHISRTVTQESELGKLAMEAFFQDDELVGPTYDISDVSVTVSQHSYDAPIEVSLWGMNDRLQPSHPSYEEVRRLLNENL